VLSPDYTIFWEVDQVKVLLIVLNYKGTINLMLEVQTLGWVGFGIAEPTSGSMPGADIVVAYVQDEEAIVTDYYATSKSTPFEDRCQQWTVEGKKEKLIEYYTA